MEIIIKNAKCASLLLSNFMPFCRFLSEDEQNKIIAASLKFVEERIEPIYLGKDN